MAVVRNGYAAWLIPDSKGTEALSTVIQALSKSPSELNPDKPDAPDLPVFSPHITLLAPQGRAATDLDYFAGCLQRAVAKLRADLGAQKGQGMGLHMSLDIPAAGTGWYQSIFAPVSETTGARAVVSFRKLLESECEEKPSSYGWFPYVPDGEWFPHFPLAYSELDKEWVGMDAMAMRADMVVKATRVAGFPMSVACREAAIVDIRGDVKDWKVVAVCPL